MDGYRIYSYPPLPVYISYFSRIHGGHTIPATLLFHSIRMQSEGGCSYPPPPIQSGWICSHSLRKSHANGWASSLQSHASSSSYSLYKAESEAATLMWGGHVVQCIILIQFVFKKDGYPLYSYPPLLIYTSYFNRIHEGYTISAMLLFYSIRMHSRGICSYPPPPCQGRWVSRYLLVFVKYVLVFA